MVRITLEPDDVNQDVHITLTDGREVVLSDADAGLLRAIARQLHVHRSSYAHAFSSDDEELEAAVREGVHPVSDASPLYLRVHQLLERARKSGGRGATTLDLQLLLQREVWTSTSGNTRPLRDLTPTHRRNLVAWLDRNSDELESRFATELPDRGDDVAAAQPWVRGTPLHQRLTELIASETERERAVDTARQVVRTVEFDRSGEWPDR